MSALKFSASAPAVVESPPVPAGSPTSLRRITRLTKAREISEGIGSKVRLCIGNPEVRCLPPFVLCKHFKIDDRGRPPHPARGAQSITYILSGNAIIEYTPSNSLEVGPGDVASLMVGKGVIRSMRATEDSRQNNFESEKHGSRKIVASGLQINVDVPEEFKRSDPSHLNLCHSDIALLEPSPGVEIRILTGKVGDRKADQMLTTTPALILDCTLQPGTSFEIPVDTNWNAFAYVTEGEVQVQGEEVSKYGYVEFMRAPQTSHSAPSKSRGSANSATKSPPETVVLAVSETAKSSARFFFCAAEPLCQPIYRQGPFVDVSMNWINQAFDDYSENKNGFEMRELWQKHERERNSRARFTGESWEIPSHQFLQSPAREGSEIEDKAGAEKTGDNNSSLSKPSNGSEDSGGPYNPCEDNDCENGDCNPSANDEHQAPPAGKASKPNVFPPGKINPASNSTEFNDTECIEEQQRDKVPRRHNARSSRSRESSTRSSASRSSSPRSAAQKRSKSKEDPNSSSPSSKRR